METGIGPGAQTGRRGGAGPVGGLLGGKAPPAARNGPAGEPDVAVSGRRRLRASAARGAPQQGAHGPWMFGSRVEAWLCLKWVCVTASRQATGVVSRYRPPPTPEPALPLWYFARPPAPPWAALPVTVVPCSSTVPPTAHSPPPSPTPPSPPQ